MLISLPKPSRWSESLALHVSTLGPFGRMPVAPGTWGSVAAVLLAPALFLPWSMPVRLAVLAVLFPVGSWCATRAERIIGRPDPGCVVIDELWGQWLTILPLAAGLADWPWLVLGCMLFRIFDIAKPWPVRAAENWLPRGWGIMLDDGVAGLYALGCVLLGRMVVYG